MSGTVRVTRVGALVEDLQGGLGKVEQIRQNKKVTGTAVSISAIGELVTFNTGATLTTKNQTIRWLLADGGDNNDYYWTGSLPKTVAPYSSPNSTGGISTNGGWATAGGGTQLLEKLAGEEGASNIGLEGGDNAQSRFNSIATKFTEVGQEFISLREDVAIEVNRASDEADRASDEADRAETAADAAFVNADVYPDVASGRAAVADGEQFQVVVGDEIVRYRRDSASAQTEVARYPSSMPVKSSARIGVMVTSSVEAIDIDFNLNLFKIVSSQVRLFYGSSSLVLPEVSLDITSAEEGRPTRIAFDTESLTYSVLDYNQSLTPGMVVVCYIRPMSQQVFGVPFYSINGEPQDGGEIPYAVGTLTFESDSVNLNTAQGTLDIVDQVVRLVIPGKPSPGLLPGQSVPLPSSAGTFGLYCLPDMMLAFVSAREVGPPGAVLIGYYLVATKRIYGFDNYYIDGEPASSDDVYAVGTLTFENSHVNLNITQGTLDIGNGVVRLVIPGKPSPGLLPGQSVPLPSSAGTFGLYCLPDMMLAFVSAREVGPPGAVLIGYYLVATKRIYGFDNYYIDGEPQTPQRESIVTAELVVAAGNFTPDYDQPELPDYSAMRSSAAGDFNNIYALYDGLEADNPEYISSSVLGVDGLGNEIKQWEFMPLSGTLDGTKREFGRRPKIVLLSGIHGEEQAGIFNLYFTMKEICERWRDDSRLEALRFGVNFIIIPIAVPTGFNAYTRKNHNGVDIARNFPSGWILRDPDSNTYGGAAPMDQAETVILDSVMSEHRDAVYLGSHHNFVGTPGTSGRTNFIWNASATDFGVELCNALISIESIKAAKRYPSLPQDSNAYLGYADRSAPSASEGYHAAHEYGINAGTFEIARVWAWGEGTQSYTTEVATIGAETLINWILMNVTHGTDLVNSRINL